MITGKNIFTIYGKCILFMYKSKYFSEGEFNKCVPSCSISDMDVEFMELLDRVRELAGIPFYITCGYRSVQWDKSKGRSGNSAHCRGKAVDIHYKSSGDAYKIISSAIQLGIKRIGIGSNFIHLDNDNSLPQGVIWNYY